MLRRKLKTGIKKGHHLRERTFMRIIIDSNISAYHFRFDMLFSGLEQAPFWQR